MRCCNYCNRDFGGTLAGAPSIIQMVVGMLADAEANRVRGVNSKTSEGMTIESYANTTMGKDIKEILFDYRKFSRG